jgi:oligopeptide/dipeptide ABC transporter ATP-binding protein
MFSGRIVEIGPTQALFRRPAHPYTRELVDATPRLGQPGRVTPTAPDASSDLAASTGCAFAPRCAFARSRCREETPRLEAVDGEPRRAACHFPLI